MIQQSAVMNDRQEQVGIFTPHLRPRIHSRISAFLKQEDLIFDLVERYGSPLNLIFPQMISENIQGFQDTYKKHRLRGRIYFTSKPCKSHALIREAEGADIGIDVSSAGSLKKAMECGWSPDRIGATGPKGKDYLRCAVESGVLVNIDNIDELKQVTVLAGARKVPLTIRNADCGPHNLKFLNADDTTFGIRTKDMDFVFSHLHQNRNVLDFKGFTYHASMASEEQRIAAMGNQLSLTFAAIDKGLNPRHINIGGGFSIMYADSCRDWADYTNTIKESVLGKIPSQTWNDNGLGYRIENGVLRGGPSYINHAPVYTKGEELDRWLSFRMPTMGNAPFSDLVRDSLLNLSVEPGRAMLDQCGITIGRVAFTKNSGNGEKLVGLEMNRSNLHSNHFKQLTDPVVIAKDKTRKNIENAGVYYMGNLCLSHDMIQYNKTYPDVLPQSDDLVAFMNTAAYMMDFTESETLMQPLAQKIAVTEAGGVWKAIHDADYRRAA